MKKKSNSTKICMISSSGGHFEQLRMLSSLSDNYQCIWVTEKTKYSMKADYYLLQTGLKDWLFIFKMIINTVKSFFIWIRERPKYVITTGTAVAIPMVFIAKIFRKKTIFIETFARLHDATKTGKLLYGRVDLFIIQWESLKKIYPEAVFGGSIY
ncbi:MAG: PssD/Cps14F family polysaccharide biosynthesis glycosyltransferase [Candidatus Izemoplasmatales bacterium]|jgi:beta-1,4-N-acetylglucosaminyltransferase